MPDGARLARHAACRSAPGLGPVSLTRDLQARGQSQLGPGHVMCVGLVGLAGDLRGLHRSAIGVESVVGVGLDGGLRWSAALGSWSGSTTASGLLGA